MSVDPLHGLEDELRVALEKIAATSDLSALESLRVGYLGRRGLMNARFAGLGQMSPEGRSFAGDKLNEAKRRLEHALTVQIEAVTVPTAEIDATLPGRHLEPGHLHPLTTFSRRILSIWRSLGYDVHDGPELESAFFNFDGLNVPPDHPARDVQDTFFVTGPDDLVLRTHASTVQLRWATTHRRQPPFRVVEVGKVYRHEATDATHESMFFQCDGVLVDRHVSMAHLITTLKTFINRLYPDRKVRIRPSFFPFVEPGIELDLWWEVPGREGRWLEILGAGLVHPHVIRAMGLKPTEWQGFAFGMGLDRLAMIEFGLPDIRLLYRGRLDVLRQF